MNPAPQLKFLEDEPSLFEERPKAATPAVAARPARQAAAPAPARSKVEKSATAHRTISEVAEELDVPQHVLRFWETKFTQLRPLKRAGGRRYYRTEDVVLIRHIHGLLYAQGYTIKGAQKVLKEKQPQATPAVDKSVEAKAAVVVARAAPKDNSRKILTDMLAELKALRALV